MKAQEYHRQFSVYCSAALVGAELIFLQAFLSMTRMESLTFIALYSFVATLPILAGGLVYHWSRDRLHPTTLTPWWLTTLHTLAMFIAFLGLTAALAQLSILIGGIFLASGALSWFIHNQMIERHLDEQKQAEHPLPPQQPQK